MMSQDAYIETMRVAIEDVLRQCLGENELGLYEMMRYHLGFADSEATPIGGSGKRLRPLLCCLACEAAGGEWRQALAAAAAIELTHNFSLVHDDIEDQDVERHHRPTVWSRWGMEQGINTGDAIWALAWAMLATATKDGVPADVVLQCVCRLALRSRQMIEGQYLDLAAEGDANTTLHDYFRIVEGKTGALLACSLELGALCGRAGNSLADAYASAGRLLGLAFQMQDDILGVWGDPAVTGKPVGNDIRQRKMSLPVVCALGQLKDEALAELRKIYRTEATPGDEEVRRVLELFGQAKARERAQQLASEYTERAVRELMGLSMQPRAGEALMNLIGSLVSRQA